MKILESILSTVSILSLLVLWSCSDQLTELNENPNTVGPSEVNSNLLIPPIQSGLGSQYLSLGFGNLSGVVQHTQEDGWFSGYNHYEWGPNNWGSWYNLLRNNKVLYEKAVEKDLKFHQGMALTQKSFIYGMITDLWGAAPFTNALKGAESSELLTPEFDNQEVIYKGILEDLKSAASLFATGDNTGYLSGYDLYYDGNVEMWHKFANSLILRYSMRLSEKLPDLARAGVESVYNSGVYLQFADEDATMGFPGNSEATSWPLAVEYDLSQSQWRRRKPCKTLMDKLLEYDDPRLEVWFQPVHVRWVADYTLTVPTEEFIREDGELLEGVISYTDKEFQIKINQEGHEYTRHFNPDLYEPDEPFTLAPIDTHRYVGLLPGLGYPDYYNANPTTGQTVENQHASQLSNLYKQSNGELLKARLASAAETHFILAEAALKGWATGDAETNYNNGIKNSLTTWGVADQYASYIAEDGVAYEGNLEQIIEQKWIAAWTATAEAWFDFRRTGLPDLEAGPASLEPVLPVRFIYGDNSLFNNTENTNAAIEGLKETPYSGPRGKNSQWSKPWIIQGTDKPW